MENAKAKTIADNRDKAINDVVEELSATGAPGNVVQLYSMQMDSCYCAWIIGKAAAKLLEMNGEIEEAQIFEVSLAFARTVATKITHGPPQQGKGGLVIPMPSLPGDLIH